MCDGLYEAVPLVLRDLRHEPKVEDDELAVGRAQHVARVRVGVEEAGLEQLREVRDDAEVDQLAHVIGGGLRELLALDPLGRVHAARRDARVVARDLHARENTHLLREADAVGALSS